MDRNKIEQLTSSLAVFLLLVLSVGFIVFFGDQFFSWDIFPPDVEKVLGFVMVSGAVLIFSSVLVNVMINLSLIAQNMSAILEDHFHIRKSKEVVRVPIARNPLVITLVIVVFGAVVMGTLSIIDQKRKAEVTNTYVAEAESWIAKNQAGLVTIFTEIFPDEMCYRYDANTTCPKPETERIASLINNDLKNFSSTFFVKKGKTNQVLLMYLSGEVAEAHGYPPENQLKLEKLLDGQGEYLPWDEYIQYFSRKEVVVAVRDGKGKLLGAVVRGVIE